MAEEFIPDTIWLQQYRVIHQAVVPYPFMTEESESDQYTVLYLWRHLRVFSYGSHRSMITFVRAFTLNFSVRVFETLSTVQLKYCKLGASHSGGYEQICLLGYNAVRAVDIQPPFSENHTSFVLMVEE
jgi:hypothetical protein